MAIKQTRRSVSISKHLYRFIMTEAARRGVSAARVIEDSLRRTQVVEHQAMRPSRGYRAVAPARVARHGRTQPSPRPSLERQMLGDGVANALGFQ